MKVMAILLCFCAWLLTYGALFAQAQSYAWYEETADKYCREDMGDSMLSAMFPPFWILAPFLTGFYEHGLKFTCFKKQAV